MVYMGSKNRIAKYIIPFITEHLNGENWFVDCMCGGCNLIDKLDYPNRIANDSNEYLIELFKYLQNGGKLPKFIDKDEYYSVKENKDTNPKWYVGHVGFNASRLGKWFDCWVGEQGGRNYQREHNNNMMKQSSQLNNVIFQSGSYEDLVLPPNSVVYCDPPYFNTRGYKDKFNHDKFFQWCRDKHAEGNKIFISEYQAPEDFKCVWAMELTTSIAVKKTTKPTEKLFTLE